MYSKEVYPATKKTYEREKDHLCQRLLTLWDLVLNFKRVNLGES